MKRRHLEIESIAMALRAISPMLVGGLVVAEVLRRNGGKRTPQERGGWTPITLSELQASDQEVLASVIPLREPGTASGQPTEQKIINVDDIPAGIPKRPDLHAVDRLIDVEDIPLQAPNYNR